MVWGEDFLKRYRQYEPRSYSLPAGNPRRCGLCLAGKGIALFMLAVLSPVTIWPLSGPKVKRTSPTLMPTVNKDLNNDQRAAAVFHDALRKALKKRKMRLESTCPSEDPVAQRILEDYGAVFLASQKVKPPPVCIFEGEEQVLAFQERAQYSSEMIDGTLIELQPAAMKAYLKAREEAIKEGLNITPRGGSEAARRNYEDSLRLWDTRFLPALHHWSAKGKLSEEQVSRLRRLPISEQVAEVLRLEEDGIFFSKDLSKSILYSIAAPGTSQHIAMLALDVTEFANSRVREILAKHGWFQTVLSDLPHFTYLGLKEADLPKYGLRKVDVAGQRFWIPNV